MSYHVAVLCRPEIAAGFGLAGVPTVEVDDGHDAMVGLNQLVERPEVGVILIEEALYGWSQEPSLLGVQPTATAPIPMGATTEDPR